MGANFNLGDFASGGGRLNPQTGEFNPNGLGNAANAINQVGQVFSEKFGRNVPRSNITQIGMMDDSNLFRTADNLGANPLGQSQVGYSNFPLSPSTGGKNYNTAFDVATGDSDYTKAAKVQAQGNLAAAQAQSSANRVNQINPYGSIQYYQSGVDAAGNPTYSAAASLSNEQQQLLNAQNQQSLGLAQTANRALGNVANTYGQAFNIDPYMQQMMGDGPQFSQYGGAPTLQTAGQGPEFAGIGNAPNLQTQVQGTGMEGWDRASNLLMSRLNPQIQQSQDRLRAQLANQGIVAGTEAYNRAMTQQAQQENDLRTQAQIAGSQIQNQMFGQNLQAGQFGNQAMLGQNQAQLANLGFNNQLGQQGYQNQLAQQQANNEALQQMFANRTNLTGLSNQDAQQMFQNQMAQQQANNMARQNNFQLASYLRGLPMQELNALRAGSQVTNPSFINVAQQGQTQGPDTLSAFQAQQNANIANQNRQAAQQSNLTSGLFNLGGSILGNLGGVGNVVSSVGSGIVNAGRGIVNSVGRLFSDIRMKENIKQVHWLPNGLPVYEYEYKPEFKDLAGHGKHIGVMAQEVAQVVPEAVSMQDNGYMMVDYAKLT